MLGGCRTPDHPNSGVASSCCPAARCPSPWASCPRVCVGDAEVADPREVTDLLHAAWLERRPLVVELAAAQDTLRTPQRHDGPVHRLTPTFEFTVERLHFLVWANTYDARGGEPVWWHGRKAARRFAGLGVTEGGEADLVRSDGSPLFVDGGPPDPPTVASGIGRGPPLGRRGRPPGPGGPTVHARLRTGSGPAGRRGARLRPGPGHRPGRLGQDPGADRAAAPSGRPTAGSTRGR